MTTAKTIKTMYAIAKNAKETSEAAIYDDSLSEAEFDAIIDAECEANDNLIDALVDFGNGILKREDAETVVLRSFERVGQLIARLAA